MDTSRLSSSPTTVTNSPLTTCLPQSSSNFNASCYSSEDLSLEEFLNELPAAIEERKQRHLAAGSKEDPIRTLFERVHLEEDDWEPFCYTDEQKSYTRNLVATDHESFTLLLLAWNPAKASPIHDHPCDGCYMRVLRGRIREQRYRQVVPVAAVAPTTKRETSLVCTRDETFSADGGSSHGSGGCVFIEDTQGYHKVGNPSSHKMAVTLHLYCPPFQSCRIWLDENRPPCRSCISHYSEYGKRV